MSSEKYVTDTHAVFWYLTASPRLGEKALAAFRQAEQGKAIILLPSVVLAELYYLIESRSSLLNFAEEYEKIVSAGYFEIIPLRGEDILDFAELSAISEMHDRIVAGVAYREKIPLLTKDKNITESRLVMTLW